MTRTTIRVTQPSLAPLAEYCRALETVWASGILTHNGPLVQKLEGQLQKRFSLRYVACVVNGTMAIQIALRALDLEGEIITTPFTYVATSSAIAWERCKPVYVDIDPETLNIDPNKIEQAIGRRTRAILPVHTFSNPCDVESIAWLAKKHRLRVIYDGAHAMGVRYRGKPLLEYGDISTTSFHATKIFNTGEGGACVAASKGLDARIRKLRFFGHDLNQKITDEGVNGKMTEIHAALGLCNLRYWGRVLRDRREKYSLYVRLLEDLDFIRFQRFAAGSYNYSYLPVIFSSERKLLTAMRQLNVRNIHPRRYFRPSLNKVWQSGAKLPIAEEISKKVLCLPLYADIPEEVIYTISRVLHA